MLVQIGALCSHGLEASMKLNYYNEQGWGLITRGGILKPKFPVGLGTSWHVTPANQVLHRDLCLVIMTCRENP